MLKFIYLRSPDASIILSADHDDRLRRAFGRFSEERFRTDGAEVVAAYYGKNGCFLCDCQPTAERAPRLFLVERNGHKHIRREDKFGETGTPHSDACDFAYEPDEQKQLVKTWLPLRKNERQLRLVSDFSEDAPAPSSKFVSVSTRSRAPKLARILFSILHDAQIDRVHPTQNRGRLSKDKNDAILKAAHKFSVAPDRSLLDWIATSLPEYYELKRRLEAARSEGWNRPNGLFIGSFGKIEDKILYPTRNDKKPIPVVGDLSVFAEKDILRRPPYLVIGTMTFATKESTEVELLNAYVHPCFAWNDYLLVDSQIERDTLNLLINAHDWLWEKCRIEVTVEKPMYDLGAEETAEAREVCKPDFVLHYRRKGEPTKYVIVETMGYANPLYRERKLRMRSLFANIKGGEPPHPIIEYDRFKGMNTQMLDKEFMSAVCKAIIRGCAHSEPEDEQA